MPEVEVLLKYRPMGSWLGQGRPTSEGLGRYCWLADTAKPVRPDDTAEIGVHGRKGGKAPLIRREHSDAGAASPATSGGALYDVLCTISLHHRVIVSGNTWSA